jgi:hypothetical protein
MSDEPRSSSSTPSSGGRAAAWEPPSPEELQRLLPKYEIKSLLGRGGMGAVYKGTQKSLDRPVAIKILSAELDEREQGFAERFKNEAKAMGQLNHPGLVAVHDFGVAEGGLLYIAMEFVAGTDVSRMIARQGRLPPDHAMAITAHVCDALAYAHGKGIIHRDIKPANIMVGYDGVVKVADFGLAKMTQSKNSGLTQSGMAMGTLHYMAPEALTLGGSVDHRADIYAVGVMLYQMLTGKLPQGMFDPPSQQVTGLDPRYDDIVKKAIRDDREVRYQTVLELRADLDAILTAPVARVEAPETGEQAAAPAALPTQARPQRTASQTAPRQQHAAVAQPGKKSSALLVTGTLAALGVIGAAMVMLGGSGDEKTPTPAAAAAPAQELPAVKPVAAPAAPKSWPTGPNYRSAGKFRAWSAAPNDPAVDLSPLMKVSDVKQIHMHDRGWVVLRENGTTVANALGANGLKGIRRICPGFAASFALIDDKGKLLQYGVNATDTTRQPPPGMGPVKDAYLAPFFHVALQEDGKLVVWGKGFDGVNEKGNPEWKVKPALPAGRKAVAISVSDLSLAVEMDDGHLLAWHIDRGALKVPPEFGPRKTSSFAVNRNYLLAVPKDGGPTLSWPLDNAKPAVRLPDDMRAAGLVQTGREMLAVDGKGRPFVTDSFISAVPAVRDVVAAIPKVTPEHIAAHLQVAPPFNPRLIWFEEDGAESSPPVVAGWPEDGPFFRKVGRFKAWQSEPFTPPQLEQLKRLKDIQDVRQVYLAAAFWVVLRQNGDTLTSHRPETMERKNIARICPGALGFYGLIQQDGSFESMVPDMDKFPDRKPPPGQKAQDVFLAPGGNFLLTPEGGITVWGRSFDGVNQPPENSEWKEKPALPKGRKAVAVSHSEFHLACQLENRALMLWSPAGAVSLPSALAVQPFRAFATTDTQLFGILDNGLPVMWKSGEPQYKAVPGLLKADSVHEAGNKTAYFLTPEGVPHVLAETTSDVGILDPVLPFIRGAKAGLISIRVNHDGKLRKTHAAMLWFDGSPPPVSVAAATSTSSTAVMPAPSPALKPRAPEQVPDYVTRVANYQKARHAQLADLTGKYRNALATARDEAKKTGVLADVTELDAAIMRADALVAEIEKNRASTVVKPLATLPPLGSHVPQRLKDLRAIFDRELPKLESTLVTALDQSLAVVQADLVKASEIETAKALETRRKEILAAFPKPVAEPVPQPKPAVVATPPPASVESVITSTPAAPSARRPVVQGRLKAWWKVPPAGAGPLGPLKQWTNANTRQTYSGTLADLTDCVAVLCHNQKQSFHVLRANGDVVEVVTNSHNLAGNDDFSAVTINPTPGSLFTRFGENRDKCHVLDDQGRMAIVWRGLRSDAVPVAKDVADAAVEHDCALARLRDGSLVWWGRNYQNDALNKKWLQPPKEARQGVVAITQSRYVAAVLSQSGQVFAWGASGSESVSTKAVNVRDVVAVEREVYALTQSGDVIIACSSDRRLKGDVVMTDVAWIKPAGTALLAGQKDGTIVTDMVTAKLEPAIPAMLQLAKGLPPEAVDMHILHSESVEIIGPAGLVWIEPVIAASPPAQGSPPSSQAEVPITKPATKASSSLSQATKDAPFVNSLGMKFVPVPGTKVLMCIHETRRQDYEVYAAEKAGVNPEWKTPTYKHMPLSTAGDHPVVMVNRFDTLAFCDWLTAREGVRHRLPTDREWSQAAGLDGKESEKGTPYSLSLENKHLRYWGNEWPPKKNYLGNYSDQTYKEVFPKANAVGGGYTDGHAFTSPVMSFPANNLGFHDLDGNVMERCQDFFDDPAGPKELARGSYWAAWNPGQLLISHRQTGGIEKRTTHCGFRVVIELP